MPDCVILPEVRVIAPLFVKFAVPDCVIPPVVMVIVPRLLTIPLTVKMLPLGAKIEPEFTVTPVQLAAAPRDTWPEPVVAIITISAVPGTVLPTQVFFVPHAPPVAVLVLVAAFNNVTVCNNAINKTILYVVP